MPSGQSKVWIISGILLLNVVFSSIGQSIKFKHITANEGLSNGNARAILEDYQGFFWIGTEDGLQRYDGHVLVEYRHDPNDPQSIASNFVLNLFEDSHRNIWIGNLDGGLSLYDRQANIFRNFKHDQHDSTSLLSDQVRTIFETSDGTLYVGFEEGGYSSFKIPEIIPAKLAFTNNPIPGRRSEPGSGGLSDIVEDREHNLLLGLNRIGVFQLNPVTKKMTEILRDSVSNRIESLLIDSKQRLWIGTWDSGVYIYNPTNHQLVHHTAGVLPQQLKHNQIESIQEDDQGNFWIATDFGVSFLSKDSDPFGKSSFVTYTHNPYEPTSLLSNSVKDMLIDRKQRVWIATYYGGVNIYDPNAFKFDAIRSKVWSPGSLSSNNVFAFAEDRSGNLWIGTDGGGLNFVEGGLKNIRSDKFQKVDIRFNNVSADKIKSLQFDRRGDLWIGTWGSGIFKVNTTTRKSIHFGKGDNIPADEILVMKVDRNDNLWIGTFNGGVLFFDRSSNQFRSFKNPSVQNGSGEMHKIDDIHIDRSNRVWLAHQVGGLNKYDSASQSFRVIENQILSKELTILTIAEDHAGTLWLGTNSMGLISYHPETNATHIYDEKSGLANNVIYAIEINPETGHLWISTNKGLSEFDPERKSFFNFNQADGLQGNQYNPGSSFRYSDGTLLFGGTNGMDAFDPCQINTKPGKADLVFTDFWLNNVSMNVGDSLTPLRENITLTKHIDLDHTQNSFALGFALLEFGMTNRNQYAYILEGLNTSWQNVGRDRKATFTNLSPGKYTLRVRGSQDDSMTDFSERAITITIHPAWWQTQAFKLFLIGSITFTVIALVRIRMNFLISQKVKLKKKVKERTVELRQKNGQLEEKIEEIRFQNEVLNSQKIEIAEKNNEIQAQNEELTSQNEQIITQRENLKIAEQKLLDINEKLEKLVEQRTRKLEETIGELDKAVSELDRFVYSASHDLSAPLKSVLGLVQIARMEADPKKLQVYYDHIESSIKKLDRVIKSLVDFSRNYHMEIQVVPVDLKGMTDEVIEELAFWPDAQKISFRNYIKDEMKISSDAQRLKVVLHNLISNGIKYADLTKSRSFIEIDCKLNGSTYTIEVKDNGIGIEDDRQEKIFQMFYRATDRSKGSGLGLFIVREIVLKLGGDIYIKSSKGLGSVFTITIPGQRS